MYLYCYFNIPPSKEATIKSFRNEMTAHSLLMLLASLASGKDEAQGKF